MTARERLRVVPATPYAAGKLWEAVGCLAKSTDSIQTRLTWACRTLMTTVREDDFTDEDDRALFRTIQAVWSARTHGGEMGSIEAAVRELDDEAALAVVNDLLSLLYNQLPE